MFIPEPRVSLKLNIRSVLSIVFIKLINLSSDCQTEDEFVELSISDIIQQ